MAKNVILHVVVVGFHHKKGCQVEYAYPPLGGNAETLPNEWANLPSLAMPDGAHNAENDVVYFLLPSIQDAKQNVFGISCYRQIDAKELVSRPNDVTRSTVQKSVCVISRVPLFGVLKAKLQLITQAYFNERDFSKIDVLSQMYQNLVDMFEGDLVDGQASIIDISVKQFVKKFKHRALLLFKLILLERKVVFNMFPVQILGDTLVSLISLFPRLLEEGLFFASHIWPSSGLPKHLLSDLRDEEDSGPSQVVEPPRSKATDGYIEELETVLETDPLLSIKDGFGFPLSIFVWNNLFQPYVNVSFLDTINSKSARGYTIGATNHLFTMNHTLVDSLITLDEKDNVNIEIYDAELKKQLTLTTADLRFGDFIMKNIEQNELVEAAWEGGDEWIRLQFRTYLLSLYASVRIDLQSITSDFGLSFVSAWKNTFNFKVWFAMEPTETAAIPPGHMFSGQIGVRDLGIFVEHTMNGSGGAKRAMHALSNTGRNLGEASNFYGSKVKESFTTWLRGAASAVGQATSQRQVVNAHTDQNKFEKMDDSDSIDAAVEACEK